MPYIVLLPEVSVLKHVGEIRHPEDENRILGYDHRSITYLKNDVINDEDISPVVTKLYDAGDNHTRSCLKRLSKAQVAKLQKESVESLIEEVEVEDEKEK